MRHDEQGKACRKGDKHYKQQPCPFQKYYACHFLENDELAQLLAFAFCQIILHRKNKIIISNALV